MNVLKRPLGLLLSREAWVLAGLLLLVPVIWVYGPLLAIGDIRPLAAAGARYLCIGLVLLVWLAWVIHRSPARPASEGVLARLRRRQATPRDNPAGDADGERIAELRTRFREALHLLRHATVHAGRFSAWLDRLTGQYVYRLPWYLVVGSSGAGKTAALVNGGLEWSIAEQSGEAASRRVEPTQQCRWWFSNDAVLVDTPGPYLEAADAGERRGAEWGELLALLRKYRPRQPVNGVLLMVGIDDLLALNEADRAAYATRLRKPLQLLQAKLDVRVPIYLCFTRMDRLSGFSDYFSGLNRDDRAQVWGMAATPEDTTPGHSGWLSGAAFDALARRLTDGLRDVLIADPDLDSRARAYLFPQQFASLKEVIGDFCQTLFRHSPIETNPRARGIYFTSAQQNGPTLDRVLAPIRQALQVSDATPVRDAAHRSRSYFLKQFLHDAVFADAGWAGVSRSVRRRRLMLHASVVALLGLVLLTLLCGWTFSYWNNRAYLGEVNAHVAALDQQTQQPLELAGGALLPLVPLLDALRSLPRSERFELDAPSFLRYRMGLYQGRKTGDAADAVYRRALDERLLPQAATRLEKILATAPADDSEFSYDALKAYLMLHDAAHYDAGFLTAWLMLDAEKTLPSNTAPDETARLAAHLTNLFGSRTVSSPFALNESLVNSVRERLVRDSLAQRTYHLLRRELLRSAGGETVSVVSAGGPQAGLVFTRHSGKPLTDGIPALYTYQGYWDVFAKRVDGATTRLENEEPWVLGIQPEPQGEEARRKQWIAEVKRAYLNDYIDIWDAYLNDVGLIDSKSLAQSIQIARTLSATDSPLRQFLQVAANETTLLRTRSSGPAATGQAPKGGAEAGQALSALFGSGSSGQPQYDDARPESIVDTHFEPLRRLVAATGSGGDAGAAPLESNLRLLDELYGYLSSANAALSSGAPAPQTDVFDKLRADADRMPTPLRNMFGDLSRSAAGQINGAARQNLAHDAQGSIGKACRQTIAGRYPFARDAGRDVALDDFSRFFAAGGLMDSFFQKNLAAQTDTGASRWTFRRNLAGGMPADTHLLGAFQNADTIRNVFFAGNATAPSLQIELTPLDLDPGITQYSLDVDGQTIRYAHGPQIPATVKWPGSRGANLVSLQISTPNGSDGLQTQGPWALHRLLDKARITPGAAPESFVATFDFSGRKLALRVTASSSYNPFHLSQMAAFACPS